jgi:hypothetical protein
VWGALTPWPYLADASRLPITILDSGDPSLAIHTPERIGPMLGLRDPDGVLRDGLTGAGALVDGQLSENEVQHLLADQLAALGYPLAFIDLPDSDHMRLGEAALNMIADALISRPKVSSME